MSGYSGKLHKPYGAYLESLERQKNGDIFNTIYGSNNTQNIQDVEKRSVEADIDLSWLNDI